MKRSMKVGIIAAAGLVLGGCASSNTTTAQYSPDGPAYVSMAGGDALGRVMVQNRIYVARKNGENNAYARVGETLLDE